MSAPVNLLAELDRRIELESLFGPARGHDGPQPGTDALREVRAAAAELMKTQHRLIEAFGLRFEGPGYAHATGKLRADAGQYPVILDAIAALARCGDAGGADVLQDVPEGPAVERANEPLDEPQEAIKP